MNLIATIQSWHILFTFLSLPYNHIQQWLIYFPKSWWCSFHQQTLSSWYSDRRTQFKQRRHPSGHCHGHPNGSNNFPTVPHPIQGWHYKISAGIKNGLPHPKTTSFNIRFFPPPPSVPLLELKDYIRTQWAIPQGISHQITQRDILLQLQFPYQQETPQLECSSP